LNQTIVGEKRETCRHTDGLTESEKDEKNRKIRKIDG